MQQDYSTYSPKWQKRFEFFDTHGAPQDKATYRPAFKALSMRQRLPIAMNFWAFFFGFIYFAILGLWKKAAGLLLAFIGIAIVCALLPIPEAAGRGVGIAFNVMCGMSANYAYYLKQVKGQQSWNPFEGLPLL